MSMKNSNDTIWNRTSDLPICSAVEFMLSEFFIYLPTDAQESFFKNIKIYIKTAPKYFGLITIIRERII
jgi:hypothetical protein